MKTKKTKTTTATAPVPETPEQRRARQLDLLRRNCERSIERATEARAKLAAELLDAEKGLGNAVYQIPWSETFAEVQYEAWLVHDIVNVRPDEPVADLLDRAMWVYWSLTEQLLGNQFRPSSTGAFHNAFEIAKADVARRVREDLRVQLVHAGYDLGKKPEVRS